MARDVHPFFEAVVLQPTTVCNMNCRYCYLPGREKARTMDLKIAEAVADAVGNYASERPVTLIWHGGEPLAAGKKLLRSLWDIFEPLRTQNRIRHELQTNATLIDGAWCELFKTYNIQLGISVDGPDWANRDRLDWHGQETHHRVELGIERLREHEIPFSAIAVVSALTMEHPEELYDYFCGLGCHTLGINLEEKEGENLRAIPVQDPQILDFWQRLYRAWEANPRLRIREFGRFFEYADSVLRGVKHEEPPNSVDVFPTVAWNGDTVLLSPELANTCSDIYGNFVAGNVLDEGLLEIIRRAFELRYVSEFRLGCEACSRQCDLYSFCVGGQASNKFFEHGRLDTTITRFCTGSKKLLVRAILNEIPL